MNELTWKPRVEPLRPLGLLVTDDLRDKAKKRLLEMDDYHLQDLRGSYCEESVIVLGNEKKLPWIPGAVYIGQEAIAPHLYVPTQLQPSTPIDLLDTAIVRRFGDGQFVINPWLKQVYNLHQALSLSRKSLEQYL